MSLQQNAAVKTMYGIWLKDNLAHYVFISDRAKKLFVEISNLELKDGNDDEQLKGYYISFCEMVYKNPFILELDLERRANLDIVPREWDFQLVLNQYGVYVPIIFLKEHNLPVDKTFTAEKEAAIARIAEVDRWYKKSLESAKEYFEKLFAARKSVTSYKLYLATALFLVISWLFLRNVGNLPAIIRPDPVQIGISVLFFLSVVIMIRCILEYGYSKGLKEIKTNWDSFKSYQTIIEQLPVELESYATALMAPKGPEDEGILSVPENGETFVDAATARYDKLKSCIDKPNRGRQLVGTFSIIILIVAAAFLFFAQNDKYTKAIMASDFFKQIGRMAGQNGNNETEASGAGAEKGVGDYRVVAPEAEMLSDITGGETVATYKTGDVLTCYGTRKDAGGMEWYRLSDSSGKTGWVLQTSVKLIDASEIKISAASANSVLRTSSKEYAADLACDGYFATSWQEGAKGDGIGKYIAFEFGEEATVSKIVIINGNARTNESYTQNGRLKTARLVFPDGKEEKINLADEYSVTGQTVVLPTPVAAKGVRLYIEAVYKGSKYADTCVSEVSFYR